MGKIHEDLQKREAKCPKNMHKDKQIDLGLGEYKNKQWDNIFTHNISKNKKSDNTVWAGVGKKYGREDTMAALLGRAVWHHPGNLKGFHGSSGVKNLPARQETWVQSLGWENPREEDMATYSSILTWRIPGAEEPGRLQSTGSQESNMTL